MSEISSLQILADNREALLLAEAIGWLHDYRKCSEEHLQAQAPGSKTQALQRAELAKKQPNLQSISLVIQAVQQNSRTIDNLLDDRTWRQDTLGQFLSRCHNTAHFDKQEPIDGEQNYPGTQISSPFGFEQPIVTGLTKSLWNLPWQNLGQVAANRQNLQDKIKDLFSKTVADSRRPINEVDLWSWGTLVGALYKTALAGVLLTGSVPKTQDVKWRLLAIRFDGLGTLLNAARIPDLLARQELLQDGLNRVKRLLEIEYPLGSEVYRDENGSLYVVPDIPHLLQLKDQGNLPLASLILQEFAKGTVKGDTQLRNNGELLPEIILENTPWWGQDPNYDSKKPVDYPWNNQLPGIATLLEKSPQGFVDVETISGYWEKHVDDTCSSCHIRPQGPSPKAKERKVCDICEQRRADRSREWATAQPEKTIWTSEVSDVNGRIALLVGQFGLTEWLNGKMVETLLVIEPGASHAVTKTPSFSRLRRIWETTRLFWQEVQTWTLERLSDDRRRLKIFLTDNPNLGPYHVYDLQLGETELDVVWVPPQNGEKGYLLTADNLGYIARRLEAEKEIYTHPAAAAIFVEDYINFTFR